MLQERMVKPPKSLGNVSGVLLVWDRRWTQGTTVMTVWKNRWLFYFIPENEEAENICLWHILNFSEVGHFMSCFDKPYARDCGWLKAGELVSKDSWMARTLWRDRLKWKHRLLEFGIQNLSLEDRSFIESLLLPLVFFTFPLVYFFCFNVFWFGFDDFLF